MICIPPPPDTKHNDKLQPVVFRASGMRIKDISIVLSWYCLFWYKTDIFIFSFCASCSTWRLKVRLLSGHIPVWLYEKDKVYKKPQWGEGLPKSNGEGNSTALMDFGRRGWLFLHMVPKNILNCGNVLSQHAKWMHFKVHFWRWTI